MRQIKQTNAVTNIMSTQQFSTFSRKLIKRSKIPKEGDTNTLYAT